MKLRQIWRGRLEASEVAILAFAAALLLLTLYAWETVK
jgi:hypothetical protein